MSFRQILKHHLHRLRRDTRGTSAIEFAMVAPLLVVIVLAFDEVNEMSYESSNMQFATRAGIHYAMAGGTDETVAKTHANNAWFRKPADGVVTSAKVCKCAGTTWDCNAFCPDLARPEMYITVTTTGTVGGDVYKKTKTSSETVRVR